MIEHRPNAHNRDYWSAPLQGGGRGGYDYGRTPISRNKGLWDFRGYGFAVFVAVLVVCGMVFAGWVL